MHQLKKEPLEKGTIFGKWTVLHLDKTKPDRRTHYVCRCVCGYLGVVNYYHLINKASSGCRGCSGKLGPTTCKKGHDLTACGADTRGACKLCRIEQNLRRKYGLSLTDYTALLVFQKGKCAICKKPLALNPAFGLSHSAEATRAEVDHRHTPKKVKPQPSPRSTVRGLLCGGRYAGCNAKLGHVDNIEWLRNAALYLEELPAQQVLRKG